MDATANTSTGEPTLRFDLLTLVKDPTEATRWIADATRPSMEVTSAIPPVFEAYATITHEYDDGDGSDSSIGELNMVRDRVDALLPHLAAATGDVEIWFGFRYYAAYYLEDEDGRIDVYEHVFQFATGPLAALSAGMLPELVWPADRSWLLSNLYDDDWSYVGGNASLIRSLQDDPILTARRVQLGEDSIPPGHMAI